MATHTGAQGFPTFGSPGTKSWWNRRRLTIALAVGLVVVAALATIITALSVRSGVWNWPRGGAVAGSASSTNQLSGTVSNQVGGTMQNQVSGGLTVVAPHTVTVSGQGRAAVAPDIAYANLGVSLQRGTVRDALNAASAQMAKMKAALSAGGVATGDMMTTSLSVWPYTPASASAPTGYTATNGLTVKVHDLAGIGNLISKAADAVGNDFQATGVSFDRADTSAALATARAAAMSAAQAQAQNWAKLGGKTLGGIDAVTESNAMPTYTFVPQGIGGFGGGGGGVNVTPGSGYLVVQVVVTYGFSG